MRVAGLDGIFRGKRWMPDPGAPRDAQTPRWHNRDEWLHDTRHERESPYRQQLVGEDSERLWEQRADVLVCHEAPSCHQHRFAALDDLAAKRWACGQWFTATITRTTTVRLRVAGPGVMGVVRAGVRTLEGSVIRKGSRDRGRPVTDCVPWEPKIARAK
ncbi:MAG TPA: hypothetical protein VKV28_07020 [Candidatus Binataceae bacterium]|nr:hypothetical protein [Candidatus Binataceae bacterium]